MVWLIVSEECESSFSMESFFFIQLASDLIAIFFCGGLETRKRGTGLAGAIEVSLGV